MFAIPTETARLAIELSTKITSSLLPLMQTSTSSKLAKYNFNQSQSEHMNQYQYQNQKMNRIFEEGDGRSMPIPSYSVRGASKSGYMFKQGGLRNKKWQKRWMLLTREFLYYAQNSSSTHSLGAIKLENVTGVRDESNMGMFKFAIEVVFKSGQRRVYNIATASMKELKEWISAIKSNTHGIHRARRMCSRIDSSHHRNSQSRFLYLLSLSSSLPSSPSASVRCDSLMNSNDGIPLPLPASLIDLSDLVTTVHHTILTVLRSCDVQWYFARFLFMNRTSFEFWVELQTLKLQACHGTNTAHRHHQQQQQSEERDIDDDDGGDSDASFSFQERAIDLIQRYFMSGSEEDGEIESESENEGDVEPQWRPPACRLPLPGSQAMKELVLAIKQNGEEGRMITFDDFEAVEEEAKNEWIGQYSAWYHQPPQENHSIAIARLLMENEDLVERLSALDLATTKPLNDAIIVSDIAVYAAKLIGELFTVIVPSYAKTFTLYSTDEYLVDQSTHVNLSSQLTVGYLLLLFNSFVEFVASEHSLENILFYLECSLIMNSVDHMHDDGAYKQNRKRVIDRLVQLKKRYLDQGSMMEVNINDDLRVVCEDKINRLVSEGEGDGRMESFKDMINDVLSPPRQEVFRLIGFDSFKRFYHSKGLKPMSDEIKTIVNCLPERFNTSTFSQHTTIKKSLSLPPKDPLLLSISCAMQIQIDKNRQMQFIPIYGKLIIAPTAIHFKGSCFSFAASEMIRFTDVVKVRAIPPLGGLEAAIVVVYQCNAAERCIQLVGLTPAQYWMLVESLGMLWMENCPEKAKAAMERRKERSHSQTHSQGQVSVVGPVSFGLRSPSTRRKNPIPIPGSPAAAASRGGIGRSRAVVGAGTTGRSRSVYSTGVEQVSEQQWHAFFGGVRLTKYVRGEKILKENRVLYQVASGSVHLTSISTAKTIDTVHSGDVFGVLPFLEGKNVDYEASVISSEAKVYSISFKFVSEVLMSSDSNYLAGQLFKYISLYMAKKLKRLRDNVGDGLSANANANTNVSVSVSDGGEETERDPSMSIGLRGDRSQSQPTSSSLAINMAGNRLSVDNVNAVNVMSVGGLPLSTTTTVNVVRVMTSLSASASAGAGTSASDAVTTSSTPTLPTPTTPTHSPLDVSAAQAKQFHSIFGASFDREELHCVVGVQRRRHKLTKTSSRGTLYISTNYVSFVSRLMGIRTKEIKSLCSIRSIVRDDCAIELEVSGSGHEDDSILIKYIVEGVGVEDVTIKIFDVLIKLWRVSRSSALVTTPSVTSVPASASTSSSSSSSALSRSHKYDQPQDLLDTILSDEDKEVLMDGSQEYTVRKGQAIIRQQQQHHGEGEGEGEGESGVDDVEHSLFVINSGKIRVEKTADDEIKVIRLLRAPELFGENLFLTGERPTETYIAHTNSSLISFRASFVKSLTSSREYARVALATRFYWFLSLGLARQRSLSSTQLDL